MSVTAFLMPLARVLVLTAVYLLFLTSLAPGDVAVGLVLSTVLVLVLRALPTERIERAARHDRPELTPARLAGVPALLGGSLVELARGSWRVARCCLRGGLPHPALVEVDTGDCSPSAMAVWALRSGIAPDSVVVGVHPAGPDRTRGVLLLHVLDGRDPAAVQAAESDTFERRQRRVFP